MNETFVVKRNFGTGSHNFGYIPDPPEPLSDEWYEEHCHKCVHCIETEINGEIWNECDLPGCEYDEKEIEE